MGVGTGIGVVFVKNDKCHINYKVFPSEAGHLVLPINNQEDYEFFEFMKEKMNIEELSYLN